MKPKDIAFADMRIGDSASFEHVIDEKSIATFASLTGDKNPLHTDVSYAKETSFKRPIVHGMLVASLFSTLVGMYYPGRKSLYLSQTLAFKEPIYPGEEVVVQGTLTHKSESTRVITLRTEIVRSDGSMAISGEAQVKVL